MARRSKVEGLARLKAKLDAMPKKVKAAVRAALEKNADEYAADLRRLLPRDSGDLAGTVRKADGAHELAVEVSVGDAKAPYPAHLEWGHKARDGSQVPAQPTVYPLLRTKRKRFSGRVARAGRKAIKELSSS